ncbi:hypothetical protein HK100_002444 [Physocladia obscura]|uniref:Acyl-CoA thioesterase n=1 Tax=Physocladia obscura TaxID=109957 RepID=A0AAD5SVP6_9FUNG|nr:hypothetical protein HK100_002444 [Physocladia obscura]
MPLARYPLQMRVTLQFGDFDASGALNSVAVYRYFETARLAYFEKLVGPRLSDDTFAAFIRGRGVGRIMRSAQLQMHDLQFPRSRFGADSMFILAARTPLVDIQHDRFRQEYLLCLIERESSEPTVVASGDAIIVSFDHIAKRKAAVPFQILSAFREIEANNHEQV